MGRLITTFVIIIGLLIIASFEQVFVNNTYSKLEKDLTELTIIMSTQTKVDTVENKEKINNMYEYWVKKEKKLALVARHADLSQISDAIIYIKNFVEFDNKEEAFAGIQRLRYLIETHSYNLSTSIQNVI